MASVKLATLAIRTIAKPISSRLKVYAQTNERFRNVCISLAQGLWSTEVRLRERLLGEVHVPARKLNDQKAIQNGANALAEGFLFSVAASLILAETYRSAKSQSNRRKDVDERMDELEEELKGAREELKIMKERVLQVEGWSDAEASRNEELSRILTRIVDIGLRGGWAEFEREPVQLPRIDRKALEALHGSPGHNETHNNSSSLEDPSTSGNS